MTLIRDLYGVYDREYAKHLARKTSRHQLVGELSANLAFLREALVEALPPGTIIDGLEDSQYRKIVDAGAPFEAIQRRPLARSTTSQVGEFQRYVGWSTERLIANAYERIAVLKKLNAGAPGIDLSARLKNLFKYLLLVLAHVEQRSLLSDPESASRRT